MLARVGLPLLRSNSNPSLDGDSAAGASSASAAFRSTLTPGGPSPFPGERLLLPTPPAGTSDPMAFLVDDSLSDLQKQKKYCLSSLPLQRLIFLRRLSSVARVFGVSATVEHLLPLLPRLAADKEDVIRQAVGIEVAALVVYLANPLKPQPQPVRPKLEDEEPWPEMWLAAADEPVPLAPPVYLHPKPSKPTPLERTIATPVSPSLKSPVASSAATPASSQPVSPTGQTSDNSGKVAAEKSVTSKGFFAKGKSLLTSAREGLSASSSPSTSPPLTPTGTSSASTSTTASSSSSSSAGSSTAPSASGSSLSSALISSQPASSSSSASSSSATSSSSSSSTSSSVSSLSSNSSSSSSSTSSDSTIDQSDGSSRADSTSQPDTSSTQVEPSLSVNTSSINSAPSSTSTSTVSSPSSSAASSPHAKPSSANRAPLSFDDPVHEIGYSHISTTLIPVIQQLLLDANSEVRTAACDALVTAADVVREQDIGTVVLTSVLNLAHDERDEQRTTAVLLMHELAPKFGYDLCKSFVALELAAFADDAIFKVRKTTAQCFGNVCAVVGESFTVSKLLSCYVRLSKDLIWGVRKGCVESMVAVCRCVPLDVRREVFVPMFERFAKDNSRWVRNGAFEVLGPLLHVLGQELITRELLHHFTNIPSMSSSVVDAEVTYHAAFNFPAVLLALGPHHWEELLPLFTSLSKDSKPAVRRTMACSLHEVGHILGPASTLQHVVPVMEAYLRDVDEVKGGVVKTFAALLRCLPADKREEYVEILWSVQKQRQHWRWRYQWARQLPAFSLLFSSDTTASSLIPLTFSLCRDSVAIVRLTASRAVGSLVKRLMSDNSGGLSAAISACKAFANGNTYMERQLFVHMCVTGDHRVLTRTGWRSIIHASVGDEVLSINTATQAMEWQPVTAVMSHAVTTEERDKLYRMQGCGMDVIATRDHRMLVASKTLRKTGRRKCVWSFGYRTVEKLLELKYGARLTKSGRRHNDGKRVVRACFNQLPAKKIVIPGLEQVCEWWWVRDGQLGFLRFLGFWLGDGHLNVHDGQVCIRQKKEAGKQWLEEQLLPHVFPRWWRSNTAATRPGALIYSIHCPPLYNYLRIMAIGPLGYNPRDPKELQSYPHFTCYDGLSEREKASEYFKVKNDATWTEAEMLAALSAEEGMEDATDDEDNVKLPAVCEARRLAEASAPMEDVGGDDGGEEEAQEEGEVDDENDSDDDITENASELEFDEFDENIFEDPSTAVSPAVWWNGGWWYIDCNGHWFYLKRWMGPAQQIATVYSQLSRLQAIALLEGFCRADGKWKSIKFDKYGDPTGQWYCSNSSFPLIDHLMLIGQLAGAAVHLHLVSKAGKTVVIDGRNAVFKTDHWGLYFTFTGTGKPFKGRPRSSPRGKTASRRLPFPSARLAEPVDVSKDVAARGFYQYVDDGRVYCITVAGNGNFLTQRLCNTVDENGNDVQRAYPIFIGNCEGLVDLIPASLFVEEFLPVICALTADPIKNVRIALAAFFSVLSARYVEYGAEREDVRAMIDKLRQDVDRDVRQAMMREEDKKKEAEKERALVEEMEKSRNESSLADSKRMDDDSDRELDEILGHSANDREEEAAERAAKSMPRRLSASQEEEILKIAEMQQQLAKDGVKEDKAENEILQPSEEKEMQRLTVDPIVLTTTKKAADNHMDVDSLKTASDGSDATTSHLPHITLPVLTHSHARVSGHPAHVATPRASVSPHSFLPADDSADQGGGSAPMEVEDNNNDTQPTDTTAVTSSSDAGESMLTEDDQPAVAIGSAADDGSVVEADKNGLHAATANGSGDASNGGTGGKPVADASFVHQNGVDKHTEELQS